jgi:HAD superfamily hydrolase (TIGR01509 family)
MQPNEPIQAVVFDMDGLLLNTEELYQHVGTEVLGRRGKDFPLELLDRMMGRPTPIALQMMIDHHQLSDTVAELSAESELLFAGILKERLQLMPGAAELLAHVESLGMTKGIATSSSRRFVDVVLGQLNLLSRFEFILTCESVTHGKPHPEIYLLAAERCNVPPARVLVLEDSQHGCRAAVDAGTFAIAVPSSQSVRHIFPGARFVAESLRDRRIYEIL